MKEQTNVDLFRLYSGTTFAQLYESFPNGVRLDSSQLVQQCGMAAEEEHERHVRLVEAG